MSLAVIGPGRGVIAVLFLFASIHGTNVTTLRLLINLTAKPNIFMNTKQYFIEIEISLKE